MSFCVFSLYVVSFSVFVCSVFFFILCLLCFFLFLCLLCLFESLLRLFLVFVSCAFFCTGTGYVKKSWPGLYTTMKKSPKERWWGAGRGVRVMSFSVLCPFLIHGWSMNCHLRFLQSFCLNYIVRPATKTTSQYMQFFLLALLCPVSWKLSPSMNCPVGSVSVLALFSYLVLCCR